MLHEPEPEIGQRFRKRRAFRGSESGGLLPAESGELPGGRLELLALGRTVRSAAAFPEFSRGPFD